MRQYECYQRGKVLSIFTDLGKKQILLAQCYKLLRTKICLHQFKILILVSFTAMGVVFAGSGRKFLQEWKTLAKKDSLNNFILNTTPKNGF
jgi:hypothetical protein